MTSVWKNVYIDKLADKLITTTIHTAESKQILLM